MKRSKVVLNFLQLTIALRILFYRKVINCLLGNAYFLIPSISLDVATAAVDALEVASIAAQDGSHLNISIRNDAEKVVNEIFRNLANYVEFIALGDETIILSSGFNTSKQPVINHKEILTVMPGSHSGSVKLTTPGEARVSACAWRMRKVSKTSIENEWVQITITTQMTYEVTGLEPGVTYEFQVSKITPDGMADYCLPVPIIVI